jgi:Meiotically up-regulated gene 113
LKKGFVVLCDVCGGKIHADNKYGICKQNVKCKQEYGRRWREVNQESKSESSRRYREANRKRSRQWDQVNREIRLARYRSEAHAELTYLFWSAGLGLHKIGYTVNIANRTRILRTGCPDLSLLVTFPYGKELEGWLKRYFKTTRLVIEGRKTEWFSDLTEVDVKNAVAEYERERGFQ